MRKRNCWRSLDIYLLTKPAVPGNRKPIQLNSPALTSKYWIHSTYKTLIRDVNPAETRPLTNAPNTTIQPHPPSGASGLVSCIASVFLSVPSPPSRHCEASFVFTLSRCWRPSELLTFESFSIIWLYVTVLEGSEIRKTFQVCVQLQLVQTLACRNDFTPVCCS